MSSAYARAKTGTAAAPANPVVTARSATRRLHVHRSAGSVPGHALPASPAQSAAFAASARGRSTNRRSAPARHAIPAPHAPATNLEIPEKRA